MMMRSLLLCAVVAVTAVPSWCLADDNRLFNIWGVQVGQRRIVAVFRPHVDENETGDSDGNNSFDLFARSQQLENDSYIEVQKLGADGTTWTPVSRIRRLTGWAEEDPGYSDNTPRAIRFVVEGNLRTVATGNETLRPRKIVLTGRLLAGAMPNQSRLVFDRRFILRANTAPDGVSPVAPLTTTMEIDPCEDVPPEDLVLVQMNIPVILPSKATTSDAP